MISERMRQVLVEIFEHPADTITIQKIADRDDLICITTESGYTAHVKVDEDTIHNHLD